MMTMLYWSYLRFRPVLFVFFVGCFFVGAAAFFVGAAVLGAAVFFVGEFV